MTSVDVEQKPEVYVGKHWGQLRIIIDGSHYTRSNQAKIIKASDSKNNVSGIDRTQR